MGFFLRKLALEQPMSEKEQTKRINVKQKYDPRHGHNGWFDGVNFH